MTARPRPRPVQPGGLRVLPGRRIASRSALGPWFATALIGIGAFLGLGFVRTSLDQSAFELSELNRSIEAQMTINERLRLEASRLENPARIAPLAEEMGMEIPQETYQLLVDLAPHGPVLAESDTERSTQ